MSRSVSIFPLLVLAGAFAADRLVWSGTYAGDLLFHQWRWHLVGAAASGIGLGLGIARQPVQPAGRGNRFGLGLVWEGVLYAATEGLPLAVLAVLLARQSRCSPGRGAAVRSSPAC